jgi:hypothetical protein
MTRFPGKTLYARVCRRQLIKTGGVGVTWGNEKFDPPPPSDRPHPVFPTNPCVARHRETDQPGCVICVTNNAKPVMAVSILEIRLIWGIFQRVYVCDVGKLSGWQAN